jgi:hypothetical protein
MDLTHYITKDYDNKSKRLTMEKQTQTKPILVAAKPFGEDGFRF